jgi:hypothetical protein
MPLTAPTWIAAIAAIALAISVIIIAWFSRLTFNAQARQHRDLTVRLAEVLDLQARQLRQSIDERRRAQACQVFIELDRIAGLGLKPGRVTASVRNASAQPVYDLYVIWQQGNVRVGKPDAAVRLMPGHQVCFERAPGPAGSASPAEPADPGALSAFLTFRDTTGIRWTVREDGTLSDMSPTPASEPAEHATQ